MAGTASGGEVRRCLCYYIAEGKQSNDSRRNDYRHDDETTSGGHNSSTPRCSVCVRNLLRSSLQRHRQALRDHAAAKVECERALGTISRNHIPELEAESQRLRDRSDALNDECRDLLERVTAIESENIAMRNSIVQESLPLERQRFDLEQLERSLLEGSLTQAIETATRQVRFLRFQWAQKVFAMHRLQIDHEHSKPELTPLQKRRQDRQTGARQERRAGGIPKISGLPLPNAGPELYAFLPPRELQSALRIVATVTSTVARCLGIVLPHRVLLTPNDSDSAVGDITDTVTEDDLRERGLVARKKKAAAVDPRTGSAPRHVSNVSDPSINPMTGAHHGGGYGADPHYHQASVMSSTASLYSCIMESSYYYNKAKKALAKAAGHRQVPVGTPSSNTITRAAAPAMESGRGSNTTERSFDTSIVQQRIHHATAAVLSDVNTATDAAVNNHCSSSTFALSTKQMNKGDDFAIALQLLQNNVITLCIRAGVPVSKLWPAEAMLLNLHELNLFCQKQTSVEY